MRSIQRLSFSNSKDNSFTEEIVLSNQGDKSISDFPLPIANYKHKLEVFDESSSILSWKDRREIYEILDSTEEDVRLRLNNQLDYGNLLWITLPKEREIQPQETRTLFIRYHYFGTIDKKNFFSFFSFPRYSLPGIAGGYPMTIFIACPAEFRLKIVKEQTRAFSLEDIGMHNQYYHVNSDNLVSYSADLQDLMSHTKDPAVTNYLQGSIILFNDKNMISLIVPSGSPNLTYLITFELEFLKDDQWRWKAATAVSIIFLSVVLVIRSSTSFFSSYFQEDTSATLIGLGTIFSAFFASILTFTRSPLLHKTHYWLFIPMILAIR